MGDESDEGGSENRDGIGNGNRNGDGNNDEGLGDSEIEEAQRGTSWGEPAFCLQLTAYGLQVAAFGSLFVVSTWEFIYEASPRVIRVGKGRKQLCSSETIATISKAVGMYAMVMRNERNDKRNIRNMRWLPSERQ